MSKLYNIKSVYSLVRTLYGIEPDANNFEDIALNGWELIGNKHTRLYKYTTDTSCQELKLPCNVDIIESVHIPIVDSQTTSNKIDGINSDSIFVERYIDAWKDLEDPFYQKGKLVKYKEGNNTLYFNRDFHNVTIIYHGIFVDEEDGLPLINDKEMKAIAAYVAYIETKKEGLRKRDKNIVTIAQMLEQEWLRKCNAARIPEHLTQNDMNAILDVKTRWDRKQYGKSLKPIL